MRCVEAFCPTICVPWQDMTDTRKRAGGQFTVSVNVVEAVILEFALSVPVTVMVYVPVGVAALVTVAVAVPVAEL